MNSEMGSIKNKLNSTKDELERDEEGIRLLQKMVDDRKADVTKLSQQVQKEKLSEKTISNNLKNKTEKLSQVQFKQKQVELENTALLKNVK